MDPNLLSLMIYVAVALIFAALCLLVRDTFLLFRGDKKKELATEGQLDIQSLLPSPETAANAEKDDSWLGQLVAEGRSDFTVETALLLAIIAGLGLGGSLYLWREEWAAGALGGVAGVLAVWALLTYLRFRRQRAIRNQLPDVMELMARAVRAGESLDQAIALVGESAFQPVAAEFRYCAGQMKMGLSLEAAIRAMVDRAPLVETRILAMTLIVQRRRGGNLPTTLERLARVFRDRSNFFRQFQAATALGRGSAALIALVAIVLDAVVILGHTEYARNLLETNVGLVLLCGSLLLQVIGISWVLWLMKSNY
jgi:tight adherence protein B